MPNSTLPSGPGKPIKEALDRIQEREGLEEGLLDQGVRTAPSGGPPATSRPKVSPDAPEDVEK
ncbi:hypothetical protein [Caldimonas brevitalea]|uniref:Uncharacterized protein n=1 Tax=Caldimonas brevitalea TaxID=413882 RepID=A0A0G3BLP9_9BURK|nr:hypothetical protein [Caldimonas brevitalea]AKJ27485.1 hypothetical protein AAW51_0794 [Caldimonas brevitalea]